MHSNSEILTFILPYSATTDRPFRVDSARSPPRAAMSPVLRIAVIGNAHRDPTVATTPFEALQKIAGGLSRPHSNYPLGHGKVDGPASAQRYILRQLAETDGKKDKRHNCQYLSTCAEAKGITPHHPGAVPLKVPSPDGCKAETNEQRPCCAHENPNTVKERTVKFDRRIELIQPKARERGSKSTWDQKPPGSSMPPGLAVSESRRELEGTQDAIDANTNNVQNSWQGCLEVPCIFCCYLYAAS